MSDKNTLNLSEELLALIKSVARQEMMNMTKELGVETSYSCKVVDVIQEEGNTDPYAQVVSVQFVGDSSAVMSNIKNKSGQMLYVGDAVLVHAIKNSLTNSYVGCKYN